MTCAMKCIFRAGCSRVANDDVKQTTEGEDAAPIEGDQAETPVREGAVDGAVLAVDADRGFAAGY